MKFQIKNTTASDLDFIYWLFDQAIIYQRKNHYPAWNGYDKFVLQQDIENQRQYKIICEDEIACIFTVLFSDDLLWTDPERASAIYLHRVVANPVFKGNKLFEKIMTWAIAHAKAHGRSILRLDTFANNPDIIGYYQKFGFKFLGEIVTSDDPGLPLQNRNLKLALMEMRI